MGKWEDGLRSQYSMILVFLVLSYFLSPSTPTPKVFLVEQEEGKTLMRKNGTSSRTQVKNKEQKGPDYSDTYARADPSLGIGNGWDDSYDSYEDWVATKEESMEDEFARADPSHGMKGWDDLDCDRCYRDMCMWCVKCGTCWNLDFCKKYEKYESCKLESSDHDHDHDQKKKRRTKEKKGKKGKKFQKKDKR